MITAKSLLPVTEDVQHSPRGGEGSIGGEKDGDEGGVAHTKRVEEVEHQLLFCACFHTLGFGNCGLEEDGKEMRSKVRRKERDNVTATPTNLSSQIV